MKILLHITADTVLGCHEALNLGLALASFDHHLQLQVGDAMVALLKNAPTGRLANMLSSLELYDLPPAWVSEGAWQNLKSSAELTELDWVGQLTPMFESVADGAFDTTFVL